MDLRMPDRSSIKQYIHFWGHHLKQVDSQYSFNEGCTKTMRRHEAVAEGSRSQNLRQLEITGKVLRGESCAEENTRYLQRVAPKPSTVLIRACMWGPSHGTGKGHHKGKKETVPKAQRGWGWCLFPTSQTGKPHNSGHAR